MIFWEHQVVSARENNKNSYSYDYKVDGYSYEIPMEKVDFSRNSLKELEDFHKKEFGEQNIEFAKIFIDPDKKLIGLMIHSRDPVKCEF